MAAPILLLALVDWFAGVQLTIAAPVAALAFSPDGQSLLFGAHKAVVVCSTANGALQRRIPFEFPKINSMVFRPDGEVLAVAGGTPGEDGVGLVLNWKDGRILQRFTNQTDVATSVAFSPDAALLAVASADRSVNVFRLSHDGVRATPSFSLTGHAGPVLAVAFSPTGKTIATAGADRSLKVWSAEDGRLIRSFNHHTEIVRCLAFRPLDQVNGETRPAYCASGSDDQTVRVWQPEIGRMVRIVRHHEGPVLAVVYSRDGGRLFSTGREGIVRVIDADSDEILGQWRAHDDWTYSLALSPDGATLATGDWNGQVKLWSLDLATARLKLQLGNIGATEKVGSPSE